MTDHHITTTNGLTPVQDQAIHRNTCLYWRQTSAALYIREEAESQVAEAFATVHIIEKPPPHPRPCLCRIRKSCTVLHKAQRLLPGKSDATPPAPVAAT